VIYDIAAVNCAIIAAFYIRFLSKPPAFNFDAYSKIALYISLIYLLAAYISSAYSLEEMVASGLFGPVFKSISISWLFLGVFIWFYRAFSFPRTVFLIGWIFGVAATYGWRLISLKGINIKWPTERILIVGQSSIAKDIIKNLKEHNLSNYRLVGQVTEAKDISKIVEEEKVTRIIITDSIKTATLEELAQLGLANLRIEVVPDLYEILVGRIDYNTLTDIPLLELTRNNVKSSYRFLKRLTDVALSSALLIISGPLIILPASIAIKLTSKGPVFYKQLRVGLDNKVFTLVKLRTMHNEAEKVTGPVLAEKNDSRVTKVGKFLRKYRLDELPQMLNIFSGQMSFVGPRPERPEFVSKYIDSIPGYASRFKMQPGATGLAQISGSYATDAQHKLKFDLFYLYHRSYLLDLKIMLKTIKVMVSGTGSH